MKKAVVCGAGNIGRGFIGETFAASGYEVVFLDVAKDVVFALNERGNYPVRIVFNETVEDILVEGVSAVDIEDVSLASNAIAEADIMATAVGVRALPFVAPLIAEGVGNRIASNRLPFNIIVCENLIEAAAELKRMTEAYLDEAVRTTFRDQVGFVDASIGRMVPPQTEDMKDGNPLRICVEPYDFLPVDADSFVGVIPDIRRMKALRNFDFYHKRKLFIHNLGHLCCALIGLVRGYVYINEAAEDAEILCIAENAMLESARALAVSYAMPLDPLLTHINNLIYRFTNTALKDTCARVVVDPERKLGRTDRLVGAASCCVASDLPFGHISIVAGLTLKRFMDMQGRASSRRSAETALKDIVGDDLDRNVLRGILDMYDVAVFEGSDIGGKGVKQMHDKAMEVSGGNLIF